MRVSQSLSWAALIPQIILMFGIMILFEYGLGIDGGTLLGAMVFLGVVFLLQFFVPFHHRQGLALIRQTKYADAKDSFERSYQFFTKNGWVDKFRAFTVFSASKISFREMALLNVAFCFHKMKAYEDARQAYQRAIQEFPESILAKTSLEVFEEAMSKKTATTEE